MEKWLGEYWNLDLMLLVCIIGGFATGNWIPTMCVIIFIVLVAIASNGENK